MSCIDFKKLACISKFLPVLFIVGSISAANSAYAQTPSSPSNFTAVAGNQRVNLGWSAVSGATSYTILRGTASGGPYSTTVTSGLTTTNYANAGLTNGTTYYYVVTATNTSGTSGNSSQASATPGTALATPTNFAAVGQTGQITLSWTPVTGATGYNIYRWTGTNPQSYSPTYSNITSNPYVDSGLTNGTLYYYAISAIGSSGAESVLSASVNAQPVTAPTGLTARAGNTQVTLSWSSSTGGARTNIYRGTTSGGEGATPIATISDHSLTYTDSGLTNGQAYYYQVSAANGSTGYGYGESTRSAEASATPMPPLPVAPTGLNALAGNHQVSLSWNSASYATSYNVKRSTTYGQGYSTISSPTGTTYTDTTATNGVTYYYIVTGVNVSGEGANSNQVDATPQASSTSASNGLTAIADSFTAQASPSSNYGYNATLYSGSPEGSRHISYFKFDLSGAGGSITSAHLNLTGSFNNSASPGVTSDSFSAYSILDNSWTELGITWANQPSLGSVLDTKSVSTGTATYSWDVTSFIKSQQASGVGQISLAVAQTTPPTVNTYATFFPREASASWPTLVVNVGGPVAPTLTATGGLKQVSLSWTSVPGAASYTVQRSTTSGGPYTAVANGTAITATSLTDSGLSDGTTYYYVLNASNGNGAGAASNEASATTNAAPTIAISASASPNPVTGTTTTLSVLGADDGGEANLNYTWSTTGASPAVASYSDNGTNTAKSTIVTFYQGGTYTFQVTVTDKTGLAVTSSISVVVNSVMSIQIIPGTIQVPLNASLGFWAQEVDQFGTALTTQPAFTWTLTGVGNINALSGLYNSGATAGSAIVQAVSGALVGTSAVTVQHNAPSIVVAASANPDPIAVGGVTTLRVAVNSDLDPSTLIYTWATIGTPPAPVTFLNNSSNSAQNMPVTLTQAGTYTFQVTITDTTGLSVTSTVSMTVLPLVAPANITATPGNNVVLINWTAVPGATGYTVYHVSGATHTPVGWLNANTTAFADTAITNGTSYTYTVTASTDTLESGYSVSTASVTPQVQPGTWSIVYTPSTGTASSPIATSHIESSASSANGRAATSVSIAGPVSGTAVVAQAEATRTGSWTATWAPNSSGVWPTLLVLKHDQSEMYVAKVASVNGSAAVTSVDGLINVSAVYPIVDSSMFVGPTMDEVWNIADLTCPVQTKTQKQDNRSSTNDANGTTIGWRRTLSKNMTAFTYYTQSYLQSHFTAPGAIVIQVPVTSVDVISSVNVTSASDASALASAFASSLDTVSGR